MLKKVTAHDGADYHYDSDDGEHLILFVPLISSIGWRRGEQ
jgi:hypothetical protein